MENKSDKITVEEKIKIMGIEELSLVFIRLVKTTSGSVKYRNVFTLKVYEDFLKCLDSVKEYLSSEYRYNRLPMCEMEIGVVDDND